MYQALYRKYRPKAFSDVVGQPHITDTLRRQVAEGRLSHAYLFTGTRGTGKTTCAKILSKAVNCLHPIDGDPCNQCPVCLGLDSGSILEVTEIDAASNNGVDSVRALRDEAVYSPASVKKRVYIIDEVHMLSTPAFNALLKILEEPPEHLMFILATTELHKVPATIKSRCQQFAFKRLLPDQIAQRLKYVAGQEGIALSEGGANLLARLADGGMRDGLSLLDQCRAASDEVNEDTITQCLGMAGNLEISQLLAELARGESADALAHFARLYAAGKDVRALLNELSTLTRDLLLRKTAPRSGNALLVGGYDDATMRSLSELLTAPRLIQMLTLLQDTIANLQKSGNPRTDCELCLIRLGDETLDGSAAGLSARVARLETMLSYPAAPMQSAPANPSPAPKTVLPAQNPVSGVQSGVLPARNPVMNVQNPVQSVQNPVSGGQNRENTVQNTDNPLQSVDNVVQNVGKVVQSAGDTRGALTEGEEKPFKKFKEDPWAAPAQKGATPSAATVSPPWEEDAPPPWEMEPPPAPQPTSQPAQTLAPQGFAEFTPPPAANPQPYSAPAPQSPQPLAPQDFAPPAGDDTLFWNALLPGLKPLLSPAVWPFVSNPAMTVGHLEGNGLNLEAKVSVTKAMIDKPEVLSVIAQAASARLGRSVEVRVSAPAPAVGRMDDLLEFGRSLSQD